jgi:hypothetical protein
MKLYLAYADGDLDLALSFLREVHNTHIITNRIMTRQTMFKSSYHKRWGDIEECDIFVLFSNGSITQNIELGIAIGLGKQIWIVGEKYSMWHDLSGVVYHENPKGAIAGILNPRLTKKYFRKEAHLREGDESVN